MSWWRHGTHLCTLSLHPLADHALFVVIHETVGRRWTIDAWRGRRRWCRRRGPVHPGFALGPRQLVMSWHPRFMESRTVDPLLLAVIGRAGSVTGSNWWLLFVEFVAGFQIAVLNFALDLRWGFAAGHKRVRRGRMWWDRMRVGQFVDAGSAQGFAHGTSVIARIETESTEYAVH